MRCIRLKAVYTLRAARKKIELVPDVNCHHGRYSCIYSRCRWLGIGWEDQRKDKNIIIIFVHGQNAFSACPERRGFLFVFPTSANHRTGLRCRAIRMYVLYSKTRPQTAFVCCVWRLLWRQQKAKTIQKTRLFLTSGIAAGLPEREEKMCGQRLRKYSHHSIVSRIGSKQLKTI